MVVQPAFRTSLNNWRGASAPRALALRGWCALPHPGVIRGLEVQEAAPRSFVQDELCAALSAGALLVHVEGALEPVGEVPRLEVVILHQRELRPPGLRARVKPPPARVAVAAAEQAEHAPSLVAMHRRDVFRPEPRQL